jgi:hypothetical protein
VTEAEWLACTDPVPLVAFLRSSGRGSDRKLRLFACACCRHLDPGLRMNDAAREAVQATERFVDGLAGPDELGAATAAASAVWYGHFLRRAETGEMPGTQEYRTDLLVRSFARIAKWASNTSRDKAVFIAAEAANQGLWTSLLGTPDWQANQARLLRDLFGPLPFRAVTVSPACVTPQVVALAQAAYDNRDLPAGTLDPARLAVLADALEEAGTGGDLLGHLRGPGPHVRGCWAVDLLLGKG